MKKLFTLAALLSIGTAFAQTENVGIGTTQPDKSAILDLSSSNKGFLLPRMSEQQRLKIETPAQGLQVYQTDGKSGLYVFNGKDWTNAANSTAAANTPWLGGGNAILPGDFLGTTNTEPLLFKVNGTQIGKLGFQNNIFLGNNAGLSNTSLFNIGIGTDALLQLSALGSSNVAIGFGSMRNSINGQNNLAIGAQTLENNENGNFNTAVGGAALYNSSGHENAALGIHSLYSASNHSTAVGSYSGKNSMGSRNVFIGYKAGMNAPSSDDKLYIANSETLTPLIYGDFAAKYVTIGDISPSLRTQGHSSLSGGYNLLVKGGILTEKVKVALAQAGTDWADYVFEDEYKKNMLTLEEVEAFTIKHKHLPNVPSAEEMVSNGLDVSQTSKMFMEKIEELTLYIIELNKRIKELELKK